MQKGWQPWTQQRFSQRKQQLSRHVRSSRYGSCLQHTCFEAEQQIAVRLTKAQQQGSELRSLGSEEAENAIKALPNNHTENCACMTSCHVSNQLGCVDGTGGWMQGCPCICSIQPAGPLLRLWPTQLHHTQCWTGSSPVPVCAWPMRHEQDARTAPAAEAVLLAFRRSPGVLPACRHILEQSASMDARWAHACMHGRHASSTAGRPCLRGGWLWGWKKPFGRCQQHVMRMVVDEPKLLGWPKHI